MPTQALAGRFEGLEPLAKARALLAGAFLRPEALAACREQLAALAATAAADDDEWVRLLSSDCTGMCRASFQAATLALEPVMVAFKRWRGSGTVIGSWRC